MRYCQEENEKQETKGVTRHLSYETRHETEFTRTRQYFFLLFFLKSSMIKYIGKKVFYSTEKHKMQKIAHFVTLHFMKLNFYFK